LSLESGPKSSEYGLKLAPRITDKKSVKQRLLAHVQAFREGRRALKKRFGSLWKDDENALLFRGLLGLVSFVFVVFLAVGVMFVQSLRPHHAEGQAHETVAEASHESGHADAAEESHESAEGGEGAHEEGGQASAPAIGVRAIPAAISKRQDGIPEGDKDLVEPEIRAGRGLASLTATPEVTAPYNPFTGYANIVGSTSEKGSQVARLAIDVSFEVDSHLAMRELQDREKEVKFVIGSLIGELTYDELRKDEGRGLLKKRIFQEVNYLLKKGKIRDVLYENFVMR